jgi:hypothetical protein
MSEQKQYTSVDTMATDPITLGEAMRIGSKLLASGKVSSNYLCNRCVTLTETGRCPALGYEGSLEALVAIPGPEGSNSSGCTAINKAVELRKRNTNSDVPRVIDSNDVAGAARIVHSPSD